MNDRTIAHQVAAVARFLSCPTPAAWFAAARDNLDVLLIDHANCEKKAAGNALSLLYRHVDNGPLLQRLSRLAREELRHFEQVHALMTALGISYRVLTAARYAGELRALVAPREPERLVDHLIVSAIVEARSCERFAGLVEVLPDPVATLYRGLLASEARHFKNYLDAARAIDTARVDATLPRLLVREAELVQSPDTEFRFHSGPPY
ncbi:MAG: tRNA-(ms[2]io[6]A)-hydroxylase [Pseudomonadales bacterium]|jgi:tRNA-(ms[2]io[6]A)-hydroxylase